MAQLTGFLIVAAGAGINAVHAVQTSTDPFPTLMGGVIFGTLCVGLDTATGTRVGTLMAALFLLSSFLLNGVPLIQAANSITTSPKG